MINCKNIREFTDKSDEGKMLLAAISILSSIDIEDIKKNKYGGMSHPDNVLKQIVHLTNLIYFEEEYQRHQEAIKRESKIDSILDKDETIN